MRKRHLAIGAVLAAGALMLAGCSGTSGSSSDSTDGKGKTLTLWHFESEDSAMGSDGRKLAGRVLANPRSRVKDKKLAAGVLSLTARSKKTK